MRNGSKSDKTKDGQPPEESWSASSFAAGDPNHKLSGWVGRFYRPLLLVGLGVTFLIGGWVFPDADVPMRLGVTALVIGGLWTVAVGFALGTLRLASAIALVTVVFLLTGVGGGVSRNQDLAAYRSLQHELEIEFNLLRGARTTRSVVAEQLLTIGPRQLEGERLVAVAGDVSLAVAAKVEGQAATETGDEAATEVKEYLARIEVLKGELEGYSNATRAAVVAGWQSLDWSGPGPYPEKEDEDEGEDEDEEEEEEGEDEERDGDVGDQGDPLASPSAEADQTLDDDGAVAPEPAPDNRGDEPAGGETRSQLDLAERRLRSIDSTVAELTELLNRFGYTELTKESVSGVELIDLSGLPPLSPADEVRPACNDEPVSSQTFDQVMATANNCVAGCASSAEPCEPQKAKRILLQGFQARLAAFTETEDIGEGQDQLLTRLEEIRTQLDELGHPIAIHQLAMVGADELLGDVVRGLVLSDERSARLGGWGWLLLTIAAVIGYRMLETANDRRSPSPVNVLIEESGDNSKEKSVAAAALVRSHLGAASLREPSPLPGGEAVSSVARSAEAAGFENAVIKYVVSLLQSTIFPRRGVELRVSAQPASEGLTAEPAKSAKSDKPAKSVKPVKRAPERYRLMVRASTPHRKGLVFSHPFEGETLEKATKAAAYYAAEHLLDAGWTTPSWLVWSSQDGTALRAYQEVMIEKSNPSSLTEEDKASSSTQENCERLLQAVKASPGTGAALVALSNEEVLVGNLTSALHHLLLARVRHERFLTVRYRLGVTLSMMAEEIETHWELGNSSTNPAIRGAMRELNNLQGKSTPMQGADADTWREILLEQAIAELKFVEQAVKLRWILWRTRRQSERQYWLGLARSGRRRKGLEGAAKSARALAERRKLELGRESNDPPVDVSAGNKLIGSALHTAPDDWLVRYNVACYAAALGGDEVRFVGSTNGDTAAKERSAPYFDEAFDQLRSARYARNGQQLKFEWVKVDPDLAPLRQACKDERWRGRLEEVFDIKQRTEAKPSPVKRAVTIALMLVRRSG